MKIEDKLIAGCMHSFKKYLKNSYKNKNMKQDGMIGLDGEGVAGACTALNE